MPHTQRPANDVSLSRSARTQGGHFLLLSGRTIASMRRGGSPMFQPERVTLQNPSSWTTGKLTSLLTLLLFLAGVSPRLAAQASEWTWMGGSNTTGQPGV